MKNFFVFSAIAICAVLVSSEQTMAFALGGGGGGKTASKARFCFRNVEPAPPSGIGIAIWVRAPDTPLPATLGELRSKLIYAGPGEIRYTAKLKNGEWAIGYGDAADTALPDETEISEELVEGLLFSDQIYTLNGKDITIDVKKPVMEVFFQAP